MTFLVKVAYASGTVVGVGGAGLIGSNYAFPKSEMVDIKDDESKEWEAKLPTLAKKLKDQSALKAKIAPTPSSTTVASTDLDFQATPANSSEFKDKPKAVVALKAWCKKATTEEDQNKLKEELCKKSIRKGWLFGNDI